jgi:outer membrane protein TolC
VALSASLGSLLDPTEEIWSLGANLLAPLYTGGELEAGVEITEAQQRQALADYVGIGLDAFREVEAALANEVFLQDRQQQLANAESRLESASTIAQARYDAGILSIFDLTQVRRQYFDTRSQLLRVRAERLRQRVDLFLALGGDFEQNLNPDTQQRLTTEASAKR